jgi:hypothetical protein
MDFGRPYDYLPFRRVKATSESTPAFSARVKDSAITSIVPRIKEFPKSLNFNAVVKVESMLQ